MKLLTAKGMRDFAPQEKILRNKVVEKLVRVFERYGYVPLETPIVERFDVLSAKYAAGEASDAMKETFRLKDQGDRDLGLRFDLTVPFSRFVGMNPNLKMPFKRYQIGEVFRDGPIKLGRYREFWQCDVDFVGSENMISDAEIVKLSLDAFKELGLNAYLVINNRKLLQGLLIDCGVDESKLEQVIIIIDKLAKIGPKGVADELEKLGLPSSVIESINDVFIIKGTNTEVLEKLGKKVVCPLAVEGLKELKELYSYLDDESIKNVVINISLARGFAYYTGTVFEGYLRESEIKSSICGGGRFDDMIGMYLGSKEKYPACGISFGLDVISEAMKLQGLGKDKTVSKVYIIPIGCVKECFKIAQQLRDAGINTDMDIVGRNISKNMKYANTLSIPYVVIVGEEEMKQQKVKLRDMKSGKEELMSVDDVIKKLK